MSVDRYRVGQAGRDEKGVAGHRPRLLCHLAGELSLTRGIVFKGQLPPIF